MKVLNTNFFYRLPLNVPTSSVGRWRNSTINGNSSASLTSSSTIERFSCRWSSMNDIRGPVTLSTLQQTLFWTSSGETGHDCRTVKHSSTDRKSSCDVIDDVISRVCWLCYCQRLLWRRRCCELKTMADYIVFNIIPAQIVRGDDIESSAWNCCTRKQTAVEIVQRAASLSTPK